MRKSVLAGLVFALLALCGAVLTLRIWVQAGEMRDLRDRHLAAAELLAGQAAGLDATGQSEAAATLLTESRRRGTSAARIDADLTEAGYSGGGTAAGMLLFGSLAAWLLLRQRRLYHDVAPDEPQPALLPAEPAASTIFLSYARADRDAVLKVHAALAARGRDIWVDWTGIPPTADWMDEIVRAVERCDAMLFALSPHSLRSTVCRQELDHALAAGKRVLPVLLADVDDESIPDALRPINWVMCRTGEEREAAVDAVIRAVDLDLDWVQLHTRLLVRAREWQSADHDPGYLIAGTDLRRARAAVLSAAARTPPLLPLHHQFVNAAERHAAAQGRRQQRGVYLASLAFGILFPAVVYSVAFDDISESGLVRLAPVWILALVFGLTGITARRATWRRPLLGVLAGAGVLVAFFGGIFPAL
ncbi:toll/interleukin-1 receptor domain-containing protein [Paractinoplanes rishiriensis]|uniref:TIR domain-containing protein n=1 Tax=Paractinoplanes rishiriensis TaxID=1050105 RepID=A0A919KAZ8_9ACTN|nr:toll/interleukin-1 receptor domain-containing protein [Actinoplanes rishiriensis]GIE99956.1 hypothetical protein Ari01nite_74210 [Actinoplanes rishiriensis]